MLTTIDFPSVNGTVRVANTRDPSAQLLGENLGALVQILRILEHGRILTRSLAFFQYELREPGYYLIGLGTQVYF